ncbi:CSMD1, partial [Symbiodinium natans]
NGTYSWSTCFRSMFIHEANLTAWEDIYDSRGYSVHKGWVAGPNKVFRSVLRSFVDKAFGEYSHFYFMEFDAVPVRAEWLQQFVAEALYYPPAAIRGSRYRGDTWDNYLQKLPLELLFHINGNAIYTVGHPWTQYLLTQL